MELNCGTELGLVGKKTKTERQADGSSRSTEKKRVRNRERSKKTPTVLLPKQLGLEVC